MSRGDRSELGPGRTQKRGRIESGGESEGKGKRSQYILSLRGEQKKNLKKLNKWSVGEQGEAGEDSRTQAGAASIVVQMALDLKRRAMNSCLKGFKQRRH